jgi:signal transduction histidine kinase
LIVDDDASVIASLSLLLKQAGYRSLSATTPDQALNMIVGESFALVLQDMNFSRQTSGEEGLDLLKRIKARKPEIPVVLITAWGSISLAVQGVRAGAADFITKPWTHQQIIQAVNTSLDRLEADYRVQREFTANAAHELRTPLATLRARLESRFSAQQLGDVVFEIEQLARLVEQLLCLARLDSQEQFQFAAFDAHAVALEVARELAPAALESEHYVTATTPDASVPAHGNATLTRLVFRNLIENAIQYTPAGTSITLSADSATVIIADDGPGIAALAAASLFERFRRGPNASGPGAGLGLAIAKCIMERQGGRLLLDASLARGARFVMEFPGPV